MKVGGELMVRLARGEAVVEAASCVNGFKDQLVCWTD